MIIYLDVPAEQCYDRIQSGDNEAEKKIPLKYLQTVERIYKTKFLPQCREKGVNVVELDWSNPSDIEEVSSSVKLEMNATCKRIQNL